MFTLAGVVITCVITCVITITSLLPFKLIAAAAREENPAYRERLEIPMQFWAPPNRAAGSDGAVVTRGVNEAVITRGVKRRRPASALRRSPQTQRIHDRSRIQRRGGEEAKVPPAPPPSRSSNGGSVCISMQGFCFPDRDFLPSLNK